MNDEKFKDFKIVHWCSTN